MAKRLNAQYVIHTGDFGFYDDDSLERMNEKYAPIHPTEESPFPLADLIFFVGHSNTSFSTVPLSLGIWALSLQDRIPTNP
jgi:hypothetical protein